ncbi:hypothetical protein ABZS95_10300 [Streptomyces sp. NPDC005479]|uniref:hypothetical protein n=1 Tax=Streptomyces sp. NPDC005479 TaxID=3154879 RepID=UPI0033BD91EB
MSLWGFTITEQYAAAVVSLVPVILLVGIVEMHQSHKRWHDLENTDILRQTRYVRDAARSGGPLGPDHDRRMGEFAANEPVRRRWHQLTQAWLAASVLLVIAELVTLFWLALPGKPRWTWLAACDGLIIVASLCLLLLNYVKHLRYTTNEFVVAARREALRMLSEASEAIERRFLRPGDRPEQGDDQAPGQSADQR